MLSCSDFCRFSSSRVLFWKGGLPVAGVHVADSVLGGRGLFASSTLSAGSKVLSLPLEACLCPVRQL